MKFTVIEWMIAILIVSVLTNVWLQPYDSTDDKANKERSGLMLYRDNLTGCEYLQAGFGSITPRLDRDSNHVGCK